MKKIFSNNRLIAIAFLTVFSVAMSPIHATDSTSHVPVEMKYAGLIKNQPLFQLSFSGNPQQDEFTILITDDYGDLLYRENFKGENFTKKFLLNTDEIGDNTVRFEVFCKKTKQSVRYDVNRTTRFVQAVSINESR